VGEKVITSSAFNPEAFRFRTRFSSRWLSLTRSISAGTRRPTTKFWWPEVSTVHRRVPEEVPRANSRPRLLECICSSCWSPQIWQIWFASCFARLRSI